MRKMMGLAAAASLLGAQAEAQTQTQALTPETTADLRCIAALAIVAAQKPEYATGASLGVFYFAGRIEGREPKLELQSALIDEIGRLNLGDLEPESQRCGKAMSAKGRELKDIANHLPAPPERKN
jgi:hypothetical protein